MTVTSQGTGYTSLPSVDLVGGSGSGATAVASYTYGINSIGVSSGGSGYVTPGVAIIDPSGKGATATATVTAGAITAVTVTNAGSGYTAPVIEFTGAGSGAVASATLTSSILTINVTNGGFGYTSTGLPNVVLNGGGFTTPASAVADVSVLIGMQPKAIQELFTTDYGRMNATLGVEIPNTTGINQTTIPLGYIDPATEIIQDSNGMIPLGTLSDGTQIWKSHPQRRGHARHPLPPVQCSTDQPGRLGRRDPAAGPQRDRLEGDRPHEPAGGHDRCPASDRPDRTLANAQQHPSRRRHLRRPLPFERE